jgi:hypothetical protein
MLQSALFAADPLLQDIADDVGGVRISQHENANTPSVFKVQQALLIRDPACLPVSGADGAFGSESAAAVHRFKVEELGVDESQVIDDVGPLTVQRLDEIARAAEVTSVALFNQFGDALADVAIEVDDNGTPRRATTDALGIATLGLISGGTLTLEAFSLAAAIGDLLDRPVIASDPSDPGDGAVIVPQTRIAVPLTPRSRVNIAVVARVDIRVELVTDLEGTVRIAGAGMKIFREGAGVRVALQVNNGSPAQALLDRAPPSPASKTWFTLVPNDVITTLYSDDGDMDALKKSLEPIASPPAADPEPNALALLIAQSLAAAATLPPDLVGAETSDTLVFVEGEGLDDFAS